MSPSSRQTSPRIACHAVARQAHNGAAYGDVGPQSKAAQRRVVVEHRPGGGLGSGEGFLHLSDSGRLENAAGVDGAEKVAHRRIERGSAGRQEAPFVELRRKVDERGVRLRGVQLGDDRGGAVARLSTTMIS